MTTSACGTSRRLTSAAGTSAWLHSDARKLRSYETTVPCRRAACIAWVASSRVPGDRALNTPPVWNQRAPPTPKTSPRATRSYRHSCAGRNSRALIAVLSSQRGQRRLGASPDLVEPPGGHQVLGAQPAGAAGEHVGELEVLADGAVVDPAGRDEPHVRIRRGDGAHEGGAGRRPVPPP